MMTPDALRDLLPDYALGLLEGEELAQMELALQADAALRADLAAFRLLFDALNTSVPQIDPPPGLRHKIMAAASPKVLGFQLSNTVALLAAAALVLIFVLVSFLLLNGEEEKPNTQDRIAAISADDQTEWVRFTGSEEHPTLSGKIGIAADHKTVIVQMSNLDPLEPSQAYQLWLMRDNEPRSGLVFRPDESETAVLVSLPEDFSVYQAMGMTIEPEGGSPGPTSPPVFVVRLQE